MSIEIRMLLSKPFISNIFHELLPRVDGIPEVPEWVRSRTFPHALLTIDQQGFQARVQFPDLFIHTEHGDDSTQVEVVAVVFQAELVAAFDFADELVPTLNQ